MLGCCLNEFNLRLEAIMEEMKKQLLDEKKDEPDVYPDNICGRYMRFIWELMEKAETSFAAKCVNFISLSFILISTVGMTLSTIPAIAGVDENGALHFHINFLFSNPRIFFIVCSVCVFILNSAADLLVKWEWIQEAV